jgi:putative metallopeptidase DUF4344
MDRSTGIVMKSLLRTAALVALVACAGNAPSPAAAQAELTNSKIEYAYFPPKTMKYQETLDRLKSRQVLELLSQFLSPLRLPHKLFLVTSECGENASPYYSPGQWAIFLCYEFMEVLDKIAPKQGQPVQGFTRDDVVVGGFVGVVLHEAGHAVFDMLEVPMFGREEDAADAMATFIALQFNKEVARTVTKGFAYIWNMFGNPKEWEHYADEHGTSAQRFFNTLCLAYGGDPQTFKEFVDKGWLPKARAANCASEYQQVRFAFSRTILPYVDQDKMKLVQARDWLKASAPARR